jgi:hypothetical protein
MILCRCCGAYAEGNLTLLFPSALLDKVRIKAGQTLTLPPQQMQLMAAKPHCHEHFLVLVSQKARDFSGLSPKRVDGWMDGTASGRHAARRCCGYFCDRRPTVKIIELIPGNCTRC